jgi:hypothetical protein
MKKRALITAEAVEEALEAFAGAGLISKGQGKDGERVPPSTGTEVLSHTARSAGERRKAHAKPWTQRKLSLARLPVKGPDGEIVRLSPGEHNGLIKAVIEEFCARFVHGATVVYIGDTENKFEHLHADYLANLGVTIDAAAKMPDVVVHDTERNWLLLVEAVTSAGPVDGKRRKELKELFCRSTAGLVFVTAFETRRSMQSFLPLISWETEVWVAEDADHIIHFNGERFLGPYPDVTPPALGTASGSPPPKAQ